MPCPAVGSRGAPRDARATRRQRTLNSKAGSIVHLPFLSTVSWLADPSSTRWRRRCSRRPSSDALRCTGGTPRRPAASPRPGRVVAGATRRAPGRPRAPPQRRCRATARTPAPCPSPAHRGRAAPGCRRGARTARERTHRGSAEHIGFHLEIDSALTAATNSPVTQPSPSLNAPGDRMPVDPFVAVVASGHRDRAMAAAGAVGAARPGRPDRHRPRDGASWSLGSIGTRRRRWEAQRSSQCREQGRVCPVPALSPERATGECGKGMPCGA